MKKNFSVGGQAVIEGVMMRGANYYATTVRTEKKELRSEVQRIKEKPKILKLPFIRGVVNLVEMLVIGVKTLAWSANQSTDDKDEKISNKEIVFSLGLAFLFTIGVFIALPYFLSGLSGVKEETAPVAFNLIDGAIKIIIFLLYLYLISFMKDVKRLFQYHGAEHKAVYCYEAGKKLTVANVKKYSTKHPRCGTSFLFIVLIISVFIFALLPPIFSAIPGFSGMPFIYKKIILFTARIAMIPVIAGMSYELLKLSGRYHKNFFVKLMSFPGIWLQYITTKEPDSSQIEVAIRSIELVLEKEKILDLSDA